MAISISEAALRASSALILDQVRLGRGPLDFLDAVILMAVSQANVEPILRDAALHRQFATYDRVPPDDLRRPISINAVAQSLGAPFETVRRRVTRLSRVRAYRITPAGVFVPGWVVQLGAHRASLEAGYRRTQALYFRLSELGALPPIPAAEPWRGADPLRAVARSGAEYLLRLIATASAELGDLTDAVIWLEVLRSTHEHLPAEAGIDRERHQPVRVTVLAKRLGMPLETVRRRAADLVARGVLQAGDGGVTLGGETASGPNLARIADDNHRDLGRMFASLGQLGIVAAWRLGGATMAA